jgi:hypothetical protein
MATLLGNLTAFILGILEEAKVLWTYFIPWLPPDSASLEISVEGQERENWCYAAVAVSIAKFYNKETDWTQCRLATENLNNVEKKASKNYCCDHPEDPDCNTVGFIYKKETQKGALVTIKNFAQCYDGPVDLMSIVVEISSGRPVIALHNYTDETNDFYEGGHFTVISGYKGLWQDGCSLYVQDPWDNYGFTDNDIIYEQFKTYWGVVGTWDYTYFTKDDEEAGA